MKLTPADQLYVKDWAFMSFLCGMLMATFITLSYGVLVVTPEFNKLQHRIEKLEKSNKK